MARTIPKKKTIRRILRVLAIFMTFFFGMNLVTWILFVRTIGIEVVLWTILTVGSAGMIFEKEWARKTLLAGVAGGFIFNLIDMLFLSRQMDLLSLSYAMFAAVLFVFYRTPLFRSFYAGPRLGPWQVLVVDDDRGFLRLVHKSLFKRGIAALTAETGEKGLTLAEKYHPDLILLDVILPGIKGREVCRKLKENEDLKEIPVVFLTAKNSGDDIQAEMDAGAAAHLTKPVNIKELFSEIDRILGPASGKSDA